MFWPSSWPNYMIGARSIEAGNYYIWQFSCRTDNGVLTESFFFLISFIRKFKFAKNFPRSQVYKRLKLKRSIYSKYIFKIEIKWGSNFFSKTMQSWSRPPESRPCQSAEVAAQFCRMKSLICWLVTGKHMVWVNMWCDAWCDHFFQ